MKRKLFVLALAIFFISDISAQETHILGVTAVNEIVGDSLRTVMAVIEYDTEIRNAVLFRDAYDVKNRTIMNVYANDTLMRSDIGTDGRFVVLELFPYDEEASVYYRKGNETLPRNAKLSIRQVGNVERVDSLYIPAMDLYIDSNRQINLISWGEAGGH